LYGSFCPLGYGHFSTLLEKLINRHILTKMALMYIKFHPALQAFDIKNPIFTRIYAGTAPTLSLYRKRDFI